VTGVASTLRFRLAALGLVGILVPLAVLLLVSLASEERQTVNTDVADGVVTERTRGLSPWVPATAAALALPAACAAWWWAGRAVVPIRRIATVADEIQATSLDRRIGLLDAPAEVQALAASFDRMLDRLATATQVQRRLIEDASHQLRTPLAVLATNADVALADPDASTEDLREAVVATRDTVVRLRSIVDDLLAAARADHHAAASVENDLARIARDACATYADLAHAREVNVVVTAPDRCPAGIDGPPVARAVMSLVENAIRHTPADSRVDVEVGVDGTTDEPGCFVAVTDQGPGIDPADRDHIFERYWTSTGSGGEGLGIGLSIVKQVAEAHGGVDVESPVGTTGGTRFTLHFRRARAVMPD
jgi:signal transduction histidine kinase